MKPRVILFINIFLFFFILFIVEKLFFIFTCFPSGVGFSIEDILFVLFYGLPLDLSMSAYLTVIPAFFLIGSIWVRADAISKVMNVYFAIVLSILSLLAVTDILLYPHWGYHFDSDLFFLLHSPKEVFEGVSFIGLGVALLAIIIVSILLYGVYSAMIRPQILKLRLPFSIMKSFLMLVLLTGLLYFPVRGNFNAEMTDVEQVYYSNNQFLNHAAVNPQISFIYSFFNSHENLRNQFQFYNKNEAEDIFNYLQAKHEGDSIPKLLKIDRPNIILFVLDDLSANVGMDSVAPNMYALGKEGIYFDNFYANSSDADGGIVSILSGYPVQPATSILNYPRKLQTLPSITKLLQGEGYELSFYSNEKVNNDNLQDYLKNAGAISNLYSATDLSLDGNGKFEAKDDTLINRVYSDLTKRISTAPFMTVVRSFGIHADNNGGESRFKSSYLNSIAYTDSCLGQFIDSLKFTETWDNTLIIFVADRASQSSSQRLSKDDARRFHVPMIWTGGALDNIGMTISNFGAQNDFVATLLAQLNIESNEFKFSKNMLAEKSNKFAFYSYKNGFSLIADTASIVIYDNDKNRMLELKGDSSLEKQAKAFYQNMYIDLGTR